MFRNFFIATYLRNLENSIVVRRSKPFLTQIPTEVGLKGVWCPEALQCVCTQFDYLIICFKSEKKVKVKKNSRRSSSMNVLNDP